MVFTTGTFDFPINADVTGTTTPRVLLAQFGDGYSQVAGDGINTIIDVWPVTVAGGIATVKPAKDFLEVQAGVHAFYWTPPMGTQGLYRCKTWALTAQSGDNWVLTATLDRVYHP